MNEGFLNYCLEFYGPKGMYDMGMTQDEADKGARIVNMLCLEFIGDSVDRERVRDIVRVMRGEKLTRVEF